MKKIISLLLALLMTFSVVTVAFAAEGDVATDTETNAPADGETTEDGEEELPIDLGEYNWILDLPFWTVKPAFKFAKIAFKLISVYLKVGKIFGVVDKDMGDMVLEVVWDLIQKNEAGENVEAEDTTAPEETTTAAA